MNTRTETINDREFFDMGTKPRTMYGGGYSRAVKAREDALLMQRGRLKKTECIPDDIMQGKYMESTVVDISIPSPSFKPLLLSLSRSPLSKTPKQVFF